MELTKFTTGKDYWADYWEFVLVGSSGAHIYSAQEILKSRHEIY